MITIVGGTGRLGRLVAAMLVEDGHQVRLVGRSAPGDPPPGTEFLAADVRAPATLGPALSGSSVVVSAVHGMDPGSGESPAEIDRDGNLALIAAARAAGADIVLVSAVGASDQHPMELMRMKAAAEQQLRDGEPGRVDWTVVRPTAYAAMHAEVIRQLAGRRGVPRVFGRGVNPINFVDVRDAAVAVHRAVVDPSLRGAVIEVGGPEDLTMSELARLATGRQRVGHIPRAGLRTMSVLLARVRPAQSRLARMALQLDTLPMTFDATAARAAYPWLPCTPVAEALGRPDAG
ncbi:MAG TPA: NAD(P)H-binding protein [Nakamurella sp.]|nr:NAD(P)H-binding protein [Nakamurella sp.]